MSKPNHLILYLLMIFFFTTVGLNISRAASEEGDLGKEFYRELDRSAGGEIEDSAPLSNPESRGGTTSYFSYFLGLALLVGVAGAIAYTLRYLAKRNAAALPGGGGELLEVIAQTPIGKGKYLSLVEVGGKILVLGVGENSINLLSEINDKEEIDTLKIQAQAKGNRSGLPFSDYLKNVFVRSGPQMGSRGRDDEGLASDYIRTQRKRLKDLSIR